MISAGDFRNGITIELEGNVFQIIEFQHVKPGKGAAFVRTKLKNIKSGGVVEKTFRPTEKCPQARIDRKDMQYLYSDGDLFNFMDVETYDQVALNAETIGDSLKFVKENEMCKVCSHNGNVFAVEPPLFVELEITDDALELIAEKAIKRKSGARALRSIFEESLMDAMFKVPDDKTVVKVILDRDGVETGICKYEHGEAHKTYSEK